MRIQSRFYPLGRGYRVRFLYDDAVSYGVAAEWEPDIPPPMIGLALRQQFIRARCRFLRTIDRKVKA